MLPGKRTIDYDSRREEDTGCIFRDTPHGDPLLVLVEYARFYLI